MHIINLPNILTASRVAAIPFLSVLMFNDLYFSAFLVFIAAAFTDLLDGYLARKLNLITSFGTCFDPFADKLFFLSTLLVLTLKRHFPLWFSSFIIFRDILVATGSAIAIYKKGPLSIKPHITGKLVNLLLFIIILFKLVSLTFYISVPESFLVILYVFCILLSGTSFILYIFRYFRDEKLKLKNRF